MSSACGNAATAAQCRRKPDLAMALLLRPLNWSLTLTAADNGTAAAAASRVPRAAGPPRTCGRRTGACSPPTFAGGASRAERTAVDDGLIENTEMHDRAINMGHFTRHRSARQANEVVGRLGRWLGRRPRRRRDSRQRVQAGDVTGVSVDTAVTEYEWLTPAAEYDEMAAAMDAMMAGEEVEPTEPPSGSPSTASSTSASSRPAGRADASRFRPELDAENATIVHVPGAFGGATPPSPTWLPRPRPARTGAASTPSRDRRRQPQSNPSPTGSTAARPGHADAYDVVIDDDGRVHGYPAATWSSCHISFPDECITLPRSSPDLCVLPRSAPSGAPTAHGSRPAR